MPKKSLDEWEEIQYKFYEHYKGLKKWQDDNYALVCKQGWYSAFTGRQWVFHTENGMYSRPAVCNYQVQGVSTGDIVPLTMLQIRKFIRDNSIDANVICQVHDSIVCDVHEKDVDVLAKKIYTIFKDLPKTIKSYWGYDWKTPMSGEIEVGINYKEVKPYINKKGELV